ncbi:unnamed protein product [Ceutorhynchus assimilis]|uniref:Uncharacterized protein n=1 Tax=Ceutorhynchus assimilis TaxID=467358 RepID=A0A9P0DJQ9_9CUCU|nr:unnamed protein product [Ceutorhynchus assimilis]
MRIGMWKYVLFLVAVASYGSGDDPSVSEKRPSGNYNFLVEVVRKDTKERVAVGTLLSPTKVLASGKLLVLSPWRYEANLVARQRRRKRFIFSIIGLVQAVVSNAVSATIGSMAGLGGSVNSNLFSNGDITIITISPPQLPPQSPQLPQFPPQLPPHLPHLPRPMLRSTFTFVKFLIPSDIKSPKSSWAPEYRTAQFKLADTPCKKATVLGWKQGATVDIIAAKKCAEQFKIQLNDGQFCSLNEENLFCDANQQGGPVMCGDFQVGILIPGLYCNGEPFQFAPIGYYIDSIVKVMEPREDAKPLPDDNSTVPVPTTDNKGICLKTNANIFVLLLIVILL